MNVRFVPLVVGLLLLMFLFSVAVDAVSGLSTGMDTNRADITIVEEP
jgi:hypothetical protein